MLRTFSNRTAMRLNLRMKIISLQHQYHDLRTKIAGALSFTDFKNAININININIVSVDTNEILANVLSTFMARQKQD